MLPVPIHSLLEEKGAETLMRGIRSPCLRLNRRAPTTVLNLVEISLGWQCRFLGQERVSQGRHVVPKTKLGEVTEMKDGDDKTAVYGDPRPVKRCRRQVDGFFIIPVVVLSILPSALILGLCFAAWQPSSVGRK